MLYNKFFVTLDADTGEEVDMISFCNHKPKTRVLRELIDDGIKLKDIRNTTMDLMREKRSEDFEAEAGKLIAVLPDFLSQTGDFNEKDFLTDDNAYLFFALTIYLLDSVIPKLLSELEI